MGTETIRTEIKDEILYLNINRQDKLNALNQQVLKGLQALLTEVKEDRSFKIKGMILTGAGEKAFIAGADIKEMDSMTPEEGERFGTLGQEVSLLFERVPVPVIACVNGFALGGGLEMAMSCDFIYATSNAVFGQPEVNLALIPGFGGTQRLMRYVGLGHARELIYTGRNFKAEEAYSLGLLNRRPFSTKDDMIAAAEKTLGLVKGKSAVVVAKCKEVIRNGEGVPLPNGLALEKAAFRFVFETEDKEEGVKAFLEKRPPVFKHK